MKREQIERDSYLYWLENAKEGDVNSLLVWYYDNHPWSFELMVTGWIGTPDGRNWMAKQLEDKTPGVPAGPEREDHEDR